MPKGDGKKDERHVHFAEPEPKPQPVGCTFQRYSGFREYNNCSDGNRSPTWNEINRYFNES